MLDAYTVRKIAPKLLVAVVGVNLSIYLCMGAVDVTNIIGKGLGDLIRGPFIEANSFSKVPDIDTSVESTVVGVVGAGGALYGLVVLGAGIADIGILATLGLFLVSILGIVLVALAILATLVLRYGAIILLTIISPLAIACWVLPGTEKYFKAWWDIFLKVLIMFPIIAAIFAMSDVLGSIFLNANEQVNDISSVVSIFVVVFVLYAPLFLIPFAFKLAGGILGQIYDFANSRGVEGAKGRLGKWKEYPESFYAQSKAKRSQRRFERGITAKQIASGTVAGLAGGAPGGFRRRYRARSAVLGAQKSMKFAKEGAEREALQMALGDDDITRALYDGGSGHEISNNLMNQAHERFGGIDSSGKNWDTTERVKNREEAVALVQSLQSQYGDSTRKLIGATQYAQATTAFKDQDGKGQPAGVFNMAQDVGDSSLLQTRALIDIKGEQKKLGRLDTGGFSTADSLAMQKDFQEGKLTGAELEGKLLDSAIKKNSPSAIATMDHNGMNAIGKRITQRLVRAQNGLDPETGMAITGLTPQQQQANIQGEVAHLASLQDALNYASIENRESLVTEFFGKKIEGASAEMSVRDAMGNIEYETNTDGSYKMKTVVDTMGRPKQEKIAKMQVRDLTGREWIDQMRAQLGEHGRYADAHREYGASEIDQRNRRDEQMK